MPTLPETKLTFKEHPDPQLGISDWKKIPDWTCPCGCHSVYTNNYVVMCSNCHRLWELEHIRASPIQLYLESRHATEDAR